MAATERAAPPSLEASIRQGGLVGHEHRPPTTRQRALHGDTGTQPRTRQDRQRPRTA
jgi:hypothetical protein